MIYSHGFENWYVLHTVAGQEEQVAIKLNTLLNQSLSFYLPRKEVIHTVDFPSYGGPLVQGGPRGAEQDTAGSP